MEKYNELVTSTKKTVVKALKQEVFRIEKELKNPNLESGQKKRLRRTLGFLGQTLVALLA